MAMITTQLSYTILIYYIFTCLFLGVCTFLEAFAADLDGYLATADETIQELKEVNEATAMETQQRIKQLVHDIISTHSDLKMFGALYFRIGIFFIRGRYFKISRRKAF